MPNIQIHFFYHVYVFVYTVYRFLVYTFTSASIRLTTLSAFR